MLVDNVPLIIKAGNGGAGHSSFFRDAGNINGGPDGGNGGNGGSIYFKGSTNIGDLRQFRFEKKVRAKNGSNGGRNKMHGKKAKDITVLLPLGTKVTEMDTGKSYEITDITTSILMAKGGKGGKGNTEFKTSTDQAPRFAEEGEEGEEKKLFLELKLIADIGIIGLPNVGKSSLLSLLTNAKPKIADYPFTTLDPNIGMFDYYPIADIPGIIEGAASGKGLGISFLKHIEKTKILVHCIGVSDKDVKKTYQTVRDEFKKYNPELLLKPEILLITKTDLVDKEKVFDAVNLFKKMGKNVLTSSIYDPESTKKIKDALREALRSINKN